MKRLVITALSVYLLFAVGTGHLFHDHGDHCHAPHTDSRDCRQAELRSGQLAGVSPTPDLCAVCQLFKQLINPTSGANTLHDPFALADYIPADNSVCEQRFTQGLFATRAPPAL